MVLLTIATLVFQIYIMKELTSFSISEYIKQTLIPSLSSTAAVVFRKIVDGHFGGDLDRVIRLYYDRQLRMIELGGFDILGHADKMHYNSACYRPGLLDEPWYEKLMQDYFARIAKKGYMVEINSKAYHLYGTFFPNERYFPLLKELGIRVMVNSDAHYPEKINAGRPEALAALKRAGFSTVMEMHQGKWVECDLAK